MALPINVEDLLMQRKGESNRIEFKADWNPDRTYRSICAFANDLTIEFEVTTMSEFDESIVLGEPGQREKADAWQTPIGSL